MYEILENTELMFIDKIRKLYNGYWIFLTNVESTELGGIIKGIPVIIGNVKYAGAEENIYEKYSSSEYGECTGLNLINMR